MREEHVLDETYV